MVKCKWLIACDIDGTLLFHQKNHPGLNEFNAFIQKERESIVLVLNSGRSLDSILHAIKEGPIAQPDFLICSLGTEIYSNSLPESIMKDWQVRMNVFWQREMIREKLNELPYIEEQEAIHQRPSKLSYYVHNRKNLVSKIQDKLGPLSKEIKIIPSHVVYLDIMPLFAGKGEAVKFLGNRLNTPFTQIITAGDSGNDLDMLDCGLKSIVVNNYTDDLLDYPKTPLMYFSDYPGALGVLDGLIFHNVLKTTASSFLRQADGEKK